MAAVDLTPYLDSAGRASWDAVLELADAVDTGAWSVVGGQMVTVHAARFGAARHRVTTDADVVVDVRSARRSSMRTVAAFLVGAGFQVERSSDGVTRFRRDQAAVDLLAPEGLRGKVITVEAGHAVAAPGATQALARSEPLEIDLGSSSGTVRCPNLLGAIVAKAAASTEIIAATSLGRAKHQADLVLLLDLAARFALPAPADLTTKDRKRLRAAAGPLLADPHHAAWQAAEVASDVRDIIEILLDRR